MNMLDYVYEYHSVGQGLFTSGHLYHRGERKFTWVYDCGTVSKDGLLTGEINVLKKNFDSGNKKIDLLVISHFDKDHISGIKELLENFTVKILLLPYVPLWKRLLIAFDNNIALTDDYINFYLNPKSYLLSRIEGSIDEIFVVPASEGEMPPLEEGETTIEGLDDIFDLKYDAEVRDLDGEGKLKILTSKLLSVVHGTQRIWEFIPYNDQSFLENATDKFKNEVNKKKKELLNDSGDKDVILKDLKKIYDKAFGRTGYKRNLISLFLYSGPLGQRCYVTMCSSNVISNFSANHWKYHPPYTDQCLCFQPSQLLTGDGFLSKKKQLDALITYLNPSRIDKVGAFQVMHHGSKHNWHRGVADAIRPCISIFCANPNDKRSCHPHGPVVHDFLPYNPCFVDTAKRLKVFGKIF